ncbi:MAG: ATP/GTP-binding protein [Candidatus Micrarchaeia archaeon]
MFFSMYRIALIGGGGVGKSLLAFALSRYYHKSGVKCCIANLDPGCKHINYAPNFDLRKYYSLDKTMKHYRLGPNGALKKIYEDFAADAHAKKKLAESLQGFDVALLDTAGSLELFLFEEEAPLLKSVADAVLFVVDNKALRNDDDFLVLKTISAVQTIKYTLPTLTVVNKKDLLEKERKKKQQKLGLNAAHSGGREAVIEHFKNLFAEIGREQRLVVVSALERKGLNELVDAINELKCECGDLS